MSVTLEARSLRHKERWKECCGQPRLHREVHVPLGYKMGIVGRKTSLLGKKKQKGHWTQPAGERKELCRWSWKASAKGLSDWLASQAKGRILSRITLPISDGDSRWDVTPLSGWRILRDTREGRKERETRKERERERGREGEGGKDGRRF